MAESVGLHVALDLGGLAKDLESVEIGLDKQLAEILRNSAGTISRATPRFTPFDPQHDFTRKDHLPHLRETFGARATPTTATVVSSHPGAGVHEYGGTIAPRLHGVTGHGADIHIKPSRMAHKAFDAVAPDIERDLASRLQRLVREHGL